MKDIIYTCLAIIHLVSYQLVFRFGTPVLTTAILQPSLNKKTNVRLKEQGQPTEQRPVQINWNMANHSYMHGLRRTRSLANMLSKNQSTKQNRTI